MIAFANPPQVKKNPSRKTIVKTSQNNKRKKYRETWKFALKLLLWFGIAGVSFFCITELPPTPTRDTILAFVGGGCFALVLSWDICGK